MRILVISNYLDGKYLNLCYSGCKPKEHLWGTDALIGRGDEVDFCKDNDKFNLFFLLKLYIKSFKYDAYFFPVSLYSKYWGMINKLHLSPVKTVTVFHHPPFDKVFKYGSFGCSLFLSNYHWRKYKTKIKNSHYYPWGCDVNFYIHNNLVVNDSRLSISFISNGYTLRDNKTLVEAAKETKFSLSFTCRKEQIPNFDSDNIHVISNYFNTDIEILNEVKKHDVLIIPLYKSPEMVGTIGLTSFMDAVGMNMPVIVSDNSPIGEIVLSYNIGLVYHAGDAHDLARAMEQISRQEILSELKNNLLLYRQSISLENTNKIILEAFK